jgi:hypothetical protein
MFAVNNNKKRVRESDDGPRSSFAPKTFTPSDTGKPAAISKTERNRQQKLRKRTKKQTSNSRIERKAERRKHGRSDGDDEDNDRHHGVNARHEMESLLLDGVSVPETSGSGDVVAVVVPTKKSRDFSSDLKLYLDQWQAHQRAVAANDQVVLQYSPWKFNKVLQAWALEHCVDKELLSLELFKQLLLYIATVRGGARDRLREKMMLIIEENEVQASTDDAIAAEVKRAKKVLVTLGKSDEQ